MSDDRACVSWAELPHGGSSDDIWSAFKTAAFEDMVQRIQEIDRQYADEPQARVERIRELRRQHHLIIIADRYRRLSPSPQDFSGPALRKAAEFILDRTAYIAVNGEAVTKPRTRVEDKLVLSARVNWHKLMRRAGSRAELRGGWSELNSNRGLTTILRRLSAPGLTPDARADILRDHIEARVKQLLSVARELTMTMQCNLAEDDRALIRDLEKVLQRARSAQRGHKAPTRNNRARRAGGRAGKAG